MLYIFTSNKHSSDLMSQMFHYFLHYPYQTGDFKLTGERASLLPLDIISCPVLSFLVSRRFPPLEILQNCGRQDFFNQRSKQMTNVRRRMKVVTGTFIYEIMPRIFLYFLEIPLPVFVYFLDLCTISCD